MRRPSYQALKSECGKLRGGNRALRRENAALLRENSALKNRLADLQRALQTAQRGGKRQAAPFSKGPPKENPKRPGRKAGSSYGQKAHRAAPEPSQIDEVHEASFASCPHCGGKHLQETDVAPQYQVEIPRRPLYRQFNVHLGRCADCGRAVHGRHTLQTAHQ